MVLAACSSSSTGSASSSTGTPPASQSGSSGSAAGSATVDPAAAAQLKGKSIAFIPGTNDPFYISMQCAIQSEAQKYGMSVDTQIPQSFSASVQTPIVNAEIAKKPAGMLIAPTDSQALVPPLMQVASAGIPIGLVDTTLDDTSLAFTSISTDNAAGGAKAADALAKLVGEQGKVMVIAFQAGASTSDARQAGFEKEIKNFPKIQYLGAQINDNDPAKAASIVTATLAANPDLKGIFATNLFAAQGAATGLRNAGSQGTVKIVGFDAGSTQIEQLQRGDVQALVAQSPSTIGTDAVDQLVAHLTGGEVTATIGTATVVITQDNLNDADIKDSIYKDSCS